MSQEHHYFVFVPGLDNSKHLAKLLTPRLSAAGIEHVIFDAGWKNNGESFEQKLERLLRLVRVQLQGGKVDVGGYSAGVSLALNAFINEPHIGHAVGLNGRISTGNYAVEDFRSLMSAARSSEAFRASVEIVEEELRKPDLSIERRSKILTLRPMRDEIVPYETSEVRGAKNITLPFNGHILSILTGLTIHAESIPRFLKDNL